MVRLAMTRPAMGTIMFSIFFNAQDVGRIGRPVKLRDGKGSALLLKLQFKAVSAEFKQLLI